MTLEYKKSKLRGAAMAVAKYNGFEYAGPDILTSGNPRALHFVATAKAALEAKAL